MGAAEADDRPIRMRADTVPVAVERPPLTTAALTAISDGNIDACGGGFCKISRTYVCTPGHPPRLEVYAPNDPHRPPTGSCARSSARPSAGPTDLRDDA
jgi:hypothetical protein